MKNVSNQQTTRIIIVLTVFLFMLGYLFIVKVGISDVRHLLSFLVASYLIVWGAYSLATPISRSEIRSQFVLMTFSLGVALSLVELPAWLKLIDYRETFAISGSAPWERPGYQPDLELLAKPKPHYAVKIQFDRGNIGEVLCLPPHPSDPFEIKYDKDGFRNEEDLTSADIAVIGDSYVESQMMPGAQLATTRLAELTKLTVANLGQSGYGPQQELAVLKRYALPLHPKTVVWMFYEGNDLLDARGYGEAVVRLRASWDSLDSIWNRSFSRNALLWVARSIRGCVPNPYERPQAATTTVVGPGGEEQRLYVKGRSQSASLTKQELNDLQKTMTVIEEAYRLVRQEGARFIVVFIPQAFRVYRDSADFERIGGGMVQWDMNDLPDRIRKMVTDISPEIDYFDLTPALQEAVEKNILVFLSDDTHWTGEGHRVVAEMLAEVVNERSNLFANKPALQRPMPKNESILASDVILVRNLDGTIRYWSKGAQNLYGWAPHDVLGVSSHHLLKTVFPVPLEVIEEELHTSGHWEGHLIHEHRDGSKVTVLSQWDFQQNPKSLDQSITVVEVNDRLEP